MMPAEALQLARRIVDKVERNMLEVDDTGELERLRIERDDVMRVLRQTEEREVERRERERQRSRPTPEQLWREWQDVKFLRRRT